MDRALELWSAFQIVIRTAYHICQPALGVETSIELLERPDTYVTVVRLETIVCH